MVLLSAAVELPTFCSCSTAYCCCCCSAAVISAAAIAAAAVDCLAAFSAAGCTSFSAARAVLSCSTGAADPE